MAKYGFFDRVIRWRPLLSKKNIEKQLRLAKMPLIKKKKKKTVLKLSPVDRRDQSGVFWPQCTGKHGGHRTWSHRVQDKLLHLPGYSRGKCEAICPTAKAWSKWVMLSDNDLKCTTKSAWGFGMAESESRPEPKWNDEVGPSAKQCCKEKRTKTPPQQTSSVSHVVVINTQEITGVKDQCQPDIFSI